MAPRHPRHNGPAIRALRISKGKKPGPFATEAGISYQHLDNLENERKEASLEVLHRIATALDCSIRALLRDDATLNIEVPPHPFPSSPDPRPGTPSNHTASATTDRQSA